MKKLALKRLASVICAVLFLSPAARAALVTDFSTIEFWAGTGSNQAALVIDWNDGISPVSLAWGFRWDGVATGWDMLNAIAAADSRLSIVVHPSFDAVYGIYYDVTGTGAGFTPGTPGDLGGPEDGHANNPGDHYREGWYTGYWAYSVYGGDFDYDIYNPEPPFNYIGTGTYNVPGSSDYPVAWFSAPIGADSRELIDGAWDAWRFNGGPITQPESGVIPEPGSIGLIACGVFLLFRRRATRTA